jgi:hypothetical protein
VLSERRHRAAAASGETVAGGVDSFG